MNAAAKDDLVPAEPIGGALWESRTERRRCQTGHKSSAKWRSQYTTPTRPPVFRRAATSIFNCSSCDFTVVAGSVQSDQVYFSAECLATCLLANCYTQHVEWRLNY
jgi:ribosomal protein L37AE/L43A